MKEMDKKRPPLSLLKRSGKIWWNKINEKWIKCIPYNINTEVEEKPQGGSMDDNQFKQLMDKMGSIQTQVNSMGSQINSMEKRMDSMEKRFDNRMDSMEERINARLDGIDVRLDNLASIVKKNHPSDFR